LTLSWNKKIFHSLSALTIENGSDIISISALNIHRRIRSAAPLAEVFALSLQNPHIPRSQIKSADRKELSCRRKLFF
jgi:hypothetical protein